MARTRGRTHFSTARLGWAAALLVIAGALAAAVARAAPPSVKLTTIQTGGGPLGLAFGAESLWAGDSASNQLIEISSGTNQVTARIRLGIQPFDVAYAYGSVWVGSQSDSVVMRVDPKRKRVVARIRVGLRPLCLAAGAGSLWVSNETDATLSRINPRTNKVIATVSLGGQPENIAVARRTVYVANRDGSIDRVDAATNKLLRPLHIAADAHYLAVADGALWVTSYAGSDVWRFALGDARLTARIRVRPGGMGIATLKGLWVADWDLSTLTRIDPSRNRVVTVLHVGTNPHDVTSGAGSVWTANVGNGTVTRVTP